MSKYRKISSAIIEASLDGNIKTREGFFGYSRKLARVHETTMPPIPDLRRAYFDMIKKDPSKRSSLLEKMLTRRKVRSLSGVAIVTVLTKPYPCPGRCVYCPNEPVMPKSYLSNEPAAMRGLLHKFDPWKQVTYRLRALTDNGHAADKIELIVKGGTWSAYDRQYQQWFIKRCFDACNQFAARARTRTTSLEEAQKINETAGHRIIGITLETRPDRITPQEIVRLRALGCTRVELGVQSVTNRILERSGRGHGTTEVIRAAKLLKDAGCKTDFHMMPQLPGATVRSDEKDLRKIFDDPDYRPDMIKIYPTVVLESAPLYKLWKKGEYQPYSDEKLINVIMRAKTKIPRYCRISRLIRDIPSTSIIAGNAMTNLRQVIQKRMREEGLSCACLRCREIGRAGEHDPSLMKAAPKLFDDVYEASEGEEHFLSFEDGKRRVVFAFCRLRLPSMDPQGEVKEMTELMPEIRGAAFIRELHTYGHLVPIDKRDPKAAQHKGLGKKLMARAERIAKTAGYEKMAVISGVGVRAYYRKLGYQLQGTYMVKRL